VFGAGSHSDAIKVRYDDFLRVVRPTVGDVGLSRRGQTAPLSRRRPCVACASAARNHAKRLLSTVGRCCALAPSQASRWPPRTIERALLLRPLPVPQLPPSRPSQDSNVCTCDQSHTDKARCDPVGRWYPQSLKQCTAPTRSTHAGPRRSDTLRELSKSGIDQQSTVERTHPGPEGGGFCCTRINPVEAP
jgi:hypothetical protein